MPKQVRENVIKIRCSDEEKTAWQAKAGEAKISVANLIRRTLNSAEVERAPVNKTPRKFTKADPELVRQLAWMGNNLNQIARRVNESGVGNGVDLHADLIAIYRQIEGIKNAL